MQLKFNYKVCGKVVRKEGAVKKGRGRSVYSVAINGAAHATHPVDAPQTPHKSGRGAQPTQELDALEQ